MNTFKTSSNGRRFIELWEGCKLTAYQDSGGVWTIGYGHTSAAGGPKVRPGMEITQAEADALLSADLAPVEANVNYHVTATLNQNQDDALVSFEYNTGGLDRSSLLRSINGGDLSRVKADLLMWDHVGRAFNQGLYNRRLAEYILFTTGEVKGP